VRCSRGGAKPGRDRWDVWRSAAGELVRTPTTRHQAREKLRALGVLHENDLAAAPAPRGVATPGGLVEQVPCFKYLGKETHESGTSSV
jgi:hypothetical protein